jgi:exodeoxyribonuclease-5
VGSEKVDRYWVKFDEDRFSALKPVSERSEKGPKSAFKFQFSPDQETAYKGVRSWMKVKNKPVLTLGGVAGSGKSTLITALAGDAYNERIAFCALTGKATNVLRSKMRAAGVLSPYHSISTIHSLLYQCFSEQPDEDCEHEIADGSCKKCGWSGKILWQKKQGSSFGSFKWIVVDEGSMLDDELIADLSSYGIPMLVVGDHAQLPPVGGSAKLMEAPDLRLEQIHRQALGNPILELSAIIRKYGQLPATLPGNGDARVRYSKRHDFVDEMRVIYKELAREDVGVLSWTNTVRTRLNQILRQVYYDRPDLPSTPIEDDQVICLKNAFQIAFNGMRGFLRSHTPSKSKHFYEGVAEFPDDNLRFRGSINRHAFGAPQGVSQLTDFADKDFHPKNWQEMGFLLDYGYCLTVHKAQGSQFHTAVVIREKPPAATNDYYKKWMYTAVTRAAERLRIVI